MDITDPYASIAAGRDPVSSGELSDEDLRWVRKPLYEKALREVDAGDPEARIAALRVAAWLGLERALAVPAKLVRDADRGVRVSAFNLAVAARDAGRPLLREVLLGSDAELTAAALDLLGKVQDQSALTPARRLASHPDPRVRVAAAELIGLVGGASARVAIAPAADDVPAVTDAKRTAHARLAGDMERPAPTPWWGDDAMEDVPVGAEVEPVHTAPEVATSTALIPAGAKEVAAPPAESIPSPPASDAKPEAKRKSKAKARSGGKTSAGLPDPLPDEPRALAKLYAMVSVADRGAVLPRLEALPGADLAAVWMAWANGNDPAVGRGIALAAAHLGRTAFLSKARSLLRADDPGVRGAAAEAMGALGGASTLTALRPLLADPHPEVRLAAVHALQQLSARTGREGIAHGWVQPLSKDDDAGVADAVSSWALS